jgi:hypothetical protein
MELALVTLVLLFSIFCITVIAIISKEANISELAIKMLGKLTKVLPANSDDDDKKPKAA